MGGCVPSSLLGGGTNGNNSNNNSVNGDNNNNNNSGRSGELTLSRGDNSSLQQLLQSSIGKPGDSYDYLLKVLLLGDSAVGKSSIMSRFCFDSFQANLPSTIGLDYMHRFVTADSHGVVQLDDTVVDDGGVSPRRRGIHRIKVQMWDTAGQERFKAVTRNYFRGVNAYIVVFDITAKSSFLHVVDFLQAIAQFGVAGAPVLLIGNKCDLRHVRTVNEAEAIALSQAHPEIVGFLETSAKEAFQVNNAVNVLVTRFLTQMKDFEQRRKRDALLAAEESPRKGTGRKQTN
jgi:small GTP-binding protein